MLLLHLVFYLPAFLDDRVYYDYWPHTEGDTHIDQEREVNELKLLCELHQFVLNLVLTGGLRQSIIDVREEVGGLPLEGAIDGAHARASIALLNGCHEVTIHFHGRLIVLEELSFKVLAVLHLAGAIGSVDVEQGHVLAVAKDLHDWCSHLSSFKHVFKLLVCQCVQVNEDWGLRVLLDFRAD